MASLSLLLPLGSLIFLACGDKEGDGDTPADNASPIANAGVDVIADGTGRVAVNGGGSSDPDGDSLVWHWSFDRVPDGSALDTLAEPFLNNHSGDGSLTSFLPDAAGSYVVKLVVEDTAGNSSAPDFVIVTVSGGDIPVANAGLDVQAEPTVAASIDGSASYDPLGRDLTYSWLLVSKPSASAVTGLESATSATATLTPDVGGVYVASLTVNNGFYDSLPDVAYIFVASSDPAAPVALAGEDIEDGQDCLDMVLDGTDSYDPNGDPLQYMWSLQSKPAGSAANNYSFADRTAGRTTFYPDISGSYEFLLSVNDGSTWSTPDAVTAVVAERWANTPPLVEAGPLREVNAGTALCSEGAYSSWECGACEEVSVIIGTDASVNDAEHDAFQVNWSVIEGNADITGPTNELETTVSFSGAVPVEPGECARNRYRLYLSAIDCPLDEGGDVLEVDVLCCGEIYRPDTGD